MTANGAVPTVATPAAEQSRLRPATSTTSADVFAAVGATLVALLGFATSFDAVSTAMEPDFGRMAPAVPLGVDAGILISSAAYISLARRGEAPGWLRMVPHALTAATVYLNVTAGDTLAGSIAHATMVLLWALFVEVAVHVSKRRLGIETGTRMDRIRRSRWLLAPVSTLLLWRRMVLWELTSYPAALARERDRLLARVGLRKRHGWAWRWRAPVEDRVRLRLGVLSPAEVMPDITADTERTPVGEQKYSPDPSVCPGPVQASDGHAVDSKADKRRTRKRTSKPNTATAVVRLRDRHPHLPVADIAKRLKVSERTVRRHLPAPTGEVNLPVPPIDGALLNGEVQP